MAGIGLLHRVNGEGANGVDTKLIEIFRAHGVSLAGEGAGGWSRARMRCMRWMHQV